MEVETPKFDYLLKYLSPFRCSVNEDIAKYINRNQKIIFTGSGKGAIAIILRYLYRQKIINNKLDQVLVPDWLGYWIYNQINAFAFPAKTLSNQTRAIYVYHQYGFPQKMDDILSFAKENNLVVIEDCAHALESYYNGSAVGSFGDFSLYSFSKWLYCFALGGVCSKYEEFYAFANDSIDKTYFGLTSFKDIAKFMHDFALSKNYSNFEKYARILLGMSYSTYGDALRPASYAKSLCFEKIRNEINVRTARYRYFCDKVDHLGICDHLLRDGIVPYLIPIYVDKNKSINIVKLLLQKNVETGLYCFDSNRNMLAPEYISCICLPCHSGISDAKFEEILETILTNV